MPWLARIDTILFSTDSHAAAQRRSLTAFAIRIFNAFIAFASQVLLARWMGEFDYGIFVLVWVWMLIIGSLSPLGFHTSVIRYLPKYEAEGDEDAMRGIVMATRLFALFVGTAAAAIGLALVSFFPHWFENYYVVPLTLGFVCLPMIAFSDTLDGLARARNWMVLALAPAYAVRPILILAFMFAAVSLGYPPTATTALVAAIAATYLTTLAQYIAVRWRLHEVLKRGPMTVHVREWLAVSLPIFLVEGFFFLLMNTDILMVGAYMEPHDVGVYFAVVKTLALAHFVYFAVKAGVSQQYARYLANGDRNGLIRIAKASVIWTFWPTLAMAIVMLIIGKWFLMLFGEAFVSGYPLLFVLAIGVVARAGVGPAESLLNMAGHQKICAAVYGTTLAINIAFNAALIPSMGLMGAAIATTIAILAEAAMLATIVYSRLGIVMTIFNTSVPASQSTEAT
jgi:O-antigen/teichoic acid export membrane protein